MPRAEIPVVHCHFPGCADFVNYDGFIVQLLPTKRRGDPLLAVVRNSELYVLETVVEGVCLAHPVRRPQFRMFEREIREQNGFVPRGIRG